MGDEGKDVVTVCSKIRTDVPTAGGRVYTKECVKNAIEDFRKEIEKRTVFAYAGDSIKTAAVQGVVEDVGVDECGRIFSKVRILDTPEGHRVQELLRSGVRFGCSVSGYGSLDVPPWRQRAWEWVLWKLRVRRHPPTAHIVRDYNMRSVALHQDQESKNVARI